VRAKHSSTQEVIASRKRCFILALFQRLKLRGNCQVTRGSLLSISNIARSLLPHTVDSFGLAVDYHSAYAAVYL
jgi:hypothetical protein